MLSSTALLMKRREGDLNSRVQRTVDFESTAIPGYAISACIPPTCTTVIRVMSLGWHDEGRTERAWTWPFDWIGAWFNRETSIRRDRNSPFNCHCKSWRRSTTSHNYSQLRRFTRFDYCQLWWLITCISSLVTQIILKLSLIHIWRCRRSYACRSRWSPYH